VGRATRKYAKASARDAACFRPQWRRDRQYRVYRVRRFPDKVRTEYIGKSHHNILPYLIGIDGLDLAHGGVVITLYNGDQGWTFDRSGVNELPAASISEFQEQVKRNIDNLLRLRLKEPGIAIRFGGNDIVDLKQVDWVEISDSQERKFRLAVDRSTHFLIRSVVITKDEENQQINEDVSIYSKYQLKDSVWTPLQIPGNTTGSAPSKSSMTLASTILVSPTTSSANIALQARLPKPREKEQKLRQRDHIRLSVLRICRSYLGLLRLNITRTIPPAVSVFHFVTFLPMP